MAMDGHWGGVAGAGRLNFALRHWQAMLLQLMRTSLALAALAICPLLPHAAAST
jgi:hypothetical protein